MTLNRKYVICEGCCRVQFYSRCPTKRMMDWTSVWQRQRSQGMFSHDTAHIMITAWVCTGKWPLDCIVRLTHIILVSKHTTLQKHVIVFLTIGWWKIQLSCDITLQELWIFEGSDLFLTYRAYFEQNKTTSIRIQSFVMAFNSYPTISFACFSAFVQQYCCFPDCSCTCILIFKSAHRLFITIMTHSRLDSCPKEAY